MARPRIDGIDDKIIESFIARGIYSSSKEVIHEALRALVREQLRKEASSHNGSVTFDDSTYAAQLSTSEVESHASMGHLARKTKAR